MLSEAKNHALTRVGPGTPMGALLRRYWHPVAAVSELAEKNVKPVRLMGEDLVLYRTDTDGYGLVQRRCPHRGADLGQGWTEGQSLRCSYHGWMFDRSGSCVEQPYEDMVGSSAPFRDKVKIDAYQAVAFAGMIWAYLGPAPAPLVPMFEPFTWRRGFVQVILSELPCNWLQCHENSVDPVHFEWRHTNYIVRESEPGSPDRGPRHSGLEFQEFEFGIVVARSAELTTALAAPVAPTSRPETSGIACLWPNVLYTGSNLEWRVPIDDTTTLNIVWHYSPIPTDMPATEQESIPYWYGPVVDDDGELLTSHILNQDFAAWVGQGATADRTGERLGRSDAGIVMLRKRLFADLERVGRGEDPQGVIRDPASNRCILLPLDKRQMYRDGVDRTFFEERLRRVFDWRLNSDPSYAVQFGQPAPVRHAFEKAMGIDPDFLDLRGKVRRSVNGECDV
ncbi:aromatic ring-hydroxylating dioxygenase subunit alpha [Streptomyces sp. NPDC047000]|uniref:aromatic ring-hydroxylating dioxygenase subunit alpha n=1 Tax=Streptomyces sp. NPDC047000 TaxID=3155474 RepID=UPI0033DA561E